MNYLREEKFLQVRCCRDFYYGKVHFLIKACQFFNEGIQKNQACIYFGNWHLDVTNTLKKTFGYNTEELIKNNQLVILEDLSNAHPLEFFAQGSNRGFIELVRELNQNFESISMLWHLPYFEDAIYTERYKKISASINRCLNKHNIFLYFLCNFGLFLPRSSLSVFYSSFIKEK